MITAVDANILLDLLLPDQLHADESEAALGLALRRGALVVSEVAYAEISTAAPMAGDLEVFLEGSSIGLLASGRESLFAAGRAWQLYTRRRPSRLTCPECGFSQRMACPRCGRDLSPRQHILADFLIGAHALHHADGLLTRDRGFYAAYFPELTLL